MATLGFYSAEDQTKDFAYARQALYKLSYTPAQKRITSLLFVPEQDGDLGTTTGPEKDTVGPLPSALACFSGEGSLELSTTSWAGSICFE